MKNPNRGRAVRRAAVLSLVTLLLAGLVSAPASARRPAHHRPRPEVFRQRTEPAATAAPAQPGFQETIAINGLTEPTTVKFASDGRVFVAEKSGIIKVFDSLSDTTPTTFADLSTNVYNYWDRGLLGMALAPNFPTDPYVYVLYTYDGDIGGPAPKWGTPGVLSDPCPTPPGPTTDGCVASARLSRLQASGNQMTGPEQVLLSGWCQQFPSHSIGDLGFAPDGSLYVSGGDAASFTFADYGQEGSPANPCGDPPSGVGGTQTPPTAEGGALRSQDQRTSSDPAGLNGAILRVDPATGAPMPTNPNAGNADLNVARTLAFGLRNPFRFAFRPGTSELWIGDVGWLTYEEIDVLSNPLGTPVENYGWPCYEGPSRQAGYDALDLTLCEQLYPQPGAHTTPVFSYAQSSQVVPGESCPTGSSTTSGLAFYQGGNYPSTYTGALFMADYARGCIWAMRAAPNGIPAPGNILTFVTNAVAPVDLEIGPAGDLFYVSYSAGQIRRIKYTGSSNQPPTAVIEASPTSGQLPLDVDFDGTGSSDPDAGDELSYAWDLDGDGAFDDSTSATPSWTYTQSEQVLVQLTVTDLAGAFDIASVTIGAGLSAPEATIDLPMPGTTFRVGQTIAFAGSATDADDGTIPASGLSWSLILHHCPSTCHEHSLQDFVGVASGSFVGPDHDYPSYLELRLTATDSDGLQDVASLQLDPQTTTLSFASSPTGLQLTVGGVSSVTPFSRTVIAGSTNSISAPSPQSSGGSSYGFVSWSDGGAQSHNVVAGTTPTTYTATYQAIAGTAVTVSDNVFTPSRVDVNPGDTVVWTVAGPGSHTVTDSAGLGLFNSGLLSPGNSFAYSFFAAGTFQYRDPAFGQMRGTVGVRTRAVPASGTSTTVFTITWASVSAPSGYVYDVQIRRPGSTWTSWQTGTTIAQTTFVRDGNTGNYQFRSRLRRLSNGVASGWSPVAIIQVSA